MNWILTIILVFINLPECFITKQTCILSFIFIGIFLWWGGVTNCWPIVNIFFVAFSLKMHCYGFHSALVTMMLWGLNEIMYIKHRTHGLVYSTCPVKPVTVSITKRCCCCCWVTSVVSDSVRPHRRQPTRLPCPWDSPGKNTGVGCHFLL